MLLPHTSCDQSLFIKNLSIFYILLRLEWAPNFNEVCCITITTIVIIFWKNEITRNANALVQQLSYNKINIFSASWIQKRNIWMKTVITNLKELSVKYLGVPQEISCHRSLDYDSTSEPLPEDLHSWSRLKLKFWVCGAWCERRSGVVVTWRESWSDVMYSGLIMCVSRVNQRPQYE
jgi:hypothetical protein